MPSLSDPAATTLAPQGCVVTHDRNSPVADVNVARAQRSYLFYQGVGQLHVSAPQRSRSGQSHTHFKSDQTVTDEEGRFAIRRLVPGVYNLVASHENGVAFLVNIQLGRETEELIDPSQPPTFVKGRISGFKSTESTYFMPTETVTNDGLGNPSYGSLSCLRRPGKSDDRVCYAIALNMRHDCHRKLPP